MSPLCSLRSASLALALSLGIVAASSTCNPVAADEQEDDIAGEIDKCLELLRKKGKRSAKGQSHFVLGVTYFKAAKLARDDNPRRNGDVAIWFLEQAHLQLVKVDDENPGTTLVPDTLDKLRAALAGKVEKKLKVYLIKEWLDAATEELPNPLDFFKGDDWREVVDLDD